MTCKRLQIQYLYCIDSIQLLEFLFAHFPFRELFTFLLGMYITLNPECNPKTLNPKPEIRNSTLQEVVDIRMDKLKFSTLQALHKVRCSIWINENICYFTKIGLLTQYT